LLRKVYKDWKERVQLFSIEWKITSSNLLLLLRKLSLRKKKEKQWMNRSFSVRKLSILHQISNYQEEAIAGLIIKMKGEATSSLELILKMREQRLCRGPLALEIILEI
jgi:hypothetical protein